MLFHSPAFFVFFLVYFALHIATRPRWRLALIIGGSTIFYGYWNPALVWVPHTIMLAAYCGVRWIYGSADEHSRRTRLMATICALLLPLFVFKYTNFILGDVIAPILRVDVPQFHMPLPLAISFVTFTMIAFVVDSYRAPATAAAPLRDVAAYTLYFPHLIAGPILRPHELIPQFANLVRIPGMRQFLLAFLIFTIGFTKKVLVADSIAPIVDRVYADPGAFNAWYHWLAVYGFSIQIYCDFSGYTDMAIGISLALGIRLPLNFNRPYCAVSLVDFWRRWHITLSRWLRDYLYIPLGGNRRGPGRQTTNVIATMGLGGLWHGAAWHFVLWGLGHGFGIALIHWIRRAGLGLAALPRWLRIAFTFHAVTLLWIFFRAGDLTTVKEILTGLFTGSYADAPGFLAAESFIATLICATLILHRWDHRAYLRILLTRRHPAIVLFLCAICWLMSLAVGASGSGKFIYFEF